MSIKRLVSLFLVGAVLTGTFPVPTKAGPQDETLIRIVDFVPTFDPSAPANQTWSLQYEVMGPASANETMIRIFKIDRSQLERVCDSRAADRVATIVNPSTQTVGVHTATWNGRGITQTSTDAIQPEGAYCFDIRWSNVPLGSSGVQKGLFLIGHPGTVTPPPGGGNGGDDDNGNGNGGNGDGQVVGTEFVDVLVSPTEIDADKTDGGNTTFLSFTAKKDFPQGFSFRILNSAGVSVKELRTRTGFVPAGTSDIFPWNGRLNNNTKVDAGIYMWRFEVVGQNPVAGTINVHRSGDGTTPPQTRQDLEHYVDPPIFNPKAVPPQDTKIKYTINNRPWEGGLTIRIRQGSTSIRELRVIQSTIQIGSYSETWDGKYQNGCHVPMGNYEYVLSSFGRDIGSGPVSVIYATGTLPNPGCPPVMPVTPPGPDPQQPPVGPFLVGTPTAIPSLFVPSNGETTTISYTLGKNVTNFRLAIRNAFGQEVDVLEAVPSKMLPAGQTQQTHTVRWDGKTCINQGAVPCAVRQLVPNGSYTFVIEATNESFSGALTVAPPAQPGQLVISDFGPTSPSFTYAGGQTTFRFQVNQPARVFFTVYQGITTIKRFMTPDPISTNPNARPGGVISVPWDGKKDDGNWAPAGDYFYIISDERDIAPAKTGTIKIEPTSSCVPPNCPSGSGMYVSDVKSNPNQFVPQLQNTYLTFTLNQNAYVRATIMRNDGTFVAMVPSDNTEQFFEAGRDRAMVWTGMTRNPITGQQEYVQPGITYTFRIDARAQNTQFGTHAATGTVMVIGQGSGAMQIYSNGPAPSRFNPRSGGKTVLDFSTTMLPSSLNVRVYRQINNVYIRDLSVITLGPLSYRAEWYGQDAPGQYVSNGNYRIEVTAAAQNVPTVQYIANVEVTDSDLPPGGGDCGDFEDVSDDHYLCPAIEFVTSRGIFVGYDDGTLGLEKVIQRAQFLAVVQKAFDFELDDYDPSEDGDLGYLDLSDHGDEWYKPYIKTFSRLGLMVGYPDRRMRPERTMNRAELYLVYLKSALHAPRKIANFELEDHLVYKQPFIDVPMKSKWYIKYAEFAKLNGLVVTERFYPARGITRGEVIELIYNTYRKGLINFDAI